MRQERAMTLIELIVALNLIGVMAIATGSIVASLYSMKREALDKQEPFIQGQLAMQAIFERVLRAVALPSGPAFNISDNGTTLTYKRLGTGGDVEERIWLDTLTNTIKYNDGNAERVILTNVNNQTMIFSQDYGNRLAVNIALNSGEKFRVAVQPRNEFSPQNIIN